MFLVAQVYIRLNQRDSFKDSLALLDHMAVLNPTAATAKLNALELQASFASVGAGRYAALLSSFITETSENSLFGEISHSSSATSPNSGSAVAPPAESSGALFDPHVVDFDIAEQSITVSELLSGEAVGWSEEIPCVLPEPAFGFGSFAET